jgi:hypothetical protein
MLLFLGQFLGSILILLQYYCSKKGLGYSSKVFGPFNVLPPFFVLAILSRPSHSSLVEECITVSIINVHSEYYIFD